MPNGEEHDLERPDPLSETRDMAEQAQLVTPPVSRRAFWATVVVLAIVLIAFAIGLYFCG